MKRANIVKEAKITHVVVSALLLLSGVFFIAWPELYSASVRWLVGANFIVMGGVRVLGYFANDLYRLAFQYDLAVGGLSVILGVLILICPADVLETLPYVIGVFVILDGLLKLQTAFDAKAFGMKQWIGLLISAALLGACGIVVLIGTSEWNRIILVGVALIADGAENIWNTMATVRVRTKKKDRFEDLL
ncbi:MAG: hypothetical protein E7663_04110 [Ruminococcaceae bacterium]|nr:hypothetical protein [Oscillospiraceae bacterium]